MTQKHVPTEDQRKLARDAVSIGIQQEDIAVLIGIDPKTLRLHYRHELDTGAAAANVAVGKVLYEKAMDGDTTALIWWTKARMRWSEKKELDVNDVTDLSQKMREGKARSLANRTEITTDQ